MVQDKLKDYPIAIGIDLGTTNSCVSIKDGDNVKVLFNSQGQNTTPSAVAFLEDGKIEVGKAAKNQADIYPDRVIVSSKRLIGKSYEEITPLLRDHPLPYQIEKSEDGKINIVVDKKKKKPQEIGSLILVQMKSIAETYFGIEPNTYRIKAVITVPAYFNDAQRQATKDAGTAAGLNVIRIINEPTAAALSYGFEKTAKETIAVYDLGGGTFDITILSMEEGVFEVKSTNGNTTLGGDDFDNRIFKYVLDQFTRETGVDIKNNKSALQRIKTESEQAKIALSTSEETQINIPNIAFEGTKPLHLSVKLTRSKLNSLVEDLIDSSLKPCEIALKDSGLRKEDITKVILVGGMTRMPLVEEKVKKFFNKTPYKGINPDEVVARGAAIQGAILTGDVKGIVLVDVTPLSLGIETLGGVFTRIIPKNTALPVAKKQTFTTSEDNQTSVTINAFQGEREFVKDNHSMGTFNLTGIPPAPRGIPQIEVTFDIDTNGICNISAKDKATNKEQKIQVKTSGGLSEEEIKRMQEEAEKYAEEDRKRKDLVNAKNSAENDIYNAEKLLANCNEEDKQKLENAIKEVREAVSSEDIDKIRSTSSTLMTESSRIGTELHQKNQQTESNPSDNNQESSTDSNKEE